MKIDIIAQKKNPFLHREEFLIEIHSESAPGFSDLIKEFDKGNLTVVKKIKGNFGSKKFNAEVFVYENKESKEKIEKIPKKMRKKLKEEKKKEEEAKKAQEQPKSEEAQS